MIAAISLMRRRADVPLTVFRRHWLDVHGPLVCRFGGLRRYVQCHVVASPATNAAARDMGIDGFPILFFDEDAHRFETHRSPEMALCNEDSRQFIGAVSRVIADVEDIVPLTSAHSPISVIALTPSGSDDAASALRGLSRLRGLVRYQVREQGAAPNSTIPHLPVTVGGAAQARFDSLVDLEEALAGWPAPQIGLFVVEEHWQTPQTRQVPFRPAA
jgi:uncharacterized protein (TIGR02118 family)